jgi:predicted transposase
MKQTLTAKLKILPDPSDAQLLIDTMHAYSAACDFVSSYVFLFHDLSIASLHRELYHTIRERFGLRSQMAQSVLRTVVARYKTIQTNQHQWIRPKFKRAQLDLVWNRDYSLTRDKTLFSVNTLQGRIKVPFFAKGVDTSGHFGTAKLVCKHGKFFLHIPVTKEIERSPPLMSRTSSASTAGFVFWQQPTTAKGKAAFSPVLSSSRNVLTTRTCAVSCSG